MKPLRELRATQLNVQRTEHAIQTAFVSWYRRRYSNELIFSIPNGGSRGSNDLDRKITGSLLKQEGLLPGVPDLMIPGRRMFIEFKSARGCLSPAQVDVIDRLRNAGYQVHVFYSLEEAVSHFLELEKEATCPG